MFSSISGYLLKSYDCLRSKKPTNQSLEHLQIRYRGCEHQRHGIKGMSFEEIDRSGPEKAEVNINDKSGMEPKPALHVDSEKWPDSFTEGSELDWKTYPKSLAGFENYRILLQCTRAGSKSSDPIRHCSLFVVQDPIEGFEFFEDPRALRFHVLGTRGSELRVVIQRGRFQYREEFLGHDGEPQLVEIRGLSRRPFSTATRKHSITRLQSTLRKVLKAFKKRKKGPRGGCIFFVQVAFEVLGKSGFIRSEDLQQYEETLVWLFNERRRYRASKTSNASTVLAKAGENDEPFSWTDRMNEDELKEVEKRSERAKRSLSKSKTKSCVIS